MTRILQPLNPLLYSRLLARFNRITVSHAGEEALVFPETNVFGQQRYRFKGGEYYQVCCPFCDDTRFRLWINYLWGHYDEKYKTSHKDLLICYNEQCMQRNPSNVDKLYHEVYGTMDAQTVRQSPIRPGISVAGREIGSPGRVISLNDLPLDHIANQYLLSRSFEPRDLATKYNLGYCEEPAVDYPAMWNRLVIPVYTNGQYVGFQGRLLREGHPKYYFPTGATKTDWLYNMDNARHYPVLVITEGVTKVWRVGPFAVATFGSSMSGKQPTYIAEMAAQADFVVLYYDGDTWLNDDSKKRTVSSFATVTKAERAIQTLRLHVPESKLIVIRLNPGTAPDEFTTDVNHQLLLGQLQQRGWRGEAKDLLRRRTATHSFKLPPRRV